MTIYSLSCKRTESSLTPSRPSFLVFWGLGGGESPLPLPLHNFASSSRKMGVLGHYDSFWTTFPKIKEKNINLRKNKNKKFIFFIGQEIKKPDLSGQNRSNPQNPQNPQNPDKTGQIRSNPEILPRTLTLAHFGPL